jgi:hypothetical protein
MLHATEALRNRTKNSSFMPFGHLNWLFLQNLATMVHATAGAGIYVIHGANARVVTASATRNAAEFNCDSKRITDYFPTNGYLYPLMHNVSHSNMLLYVIDSR